MHLESLMVTATAPGAGGAAGAAVTGDSLTVKNGKNPRILCAWADLQAAGVVTIVRPSGHDTTRDMRFRVPASEVEMLLPFGVAADVEPQEVLGVNIIGSATAGDVEQVNLLMAYDELPGVKQSLITFSTLRRRIEKLLTVELSITSAAGPGYSGAELINAESDLLKANREYAVIGARIGVECGCLYIQGPDTGNARIPIPGNDLDGAITSDWFAQLSRAFDIPAIPVINSGNRASTYVGCHTDENAGTITASLNLALLK